MNEAYFAAAVRDTETGLDLLEQASGYLTDDEETQDHIAAKIEELRLAMKAAAKTTAGGTHPLLDALSDRVGTYSSFMGYFLREEDMT